MSFLTAHFFVGDKLLLPTRVIANVPFRTIKNNNLVHSPNVVFHTGFFK